MSKQPHKNHEQKPISSSFCIPTPIKSIAESRILLWGEVRRMQKSKLNLLMPQDQKQGDMPSLASSLDIQEQKKSNSKGAELMSVKMQPGAD
jgi:hypothetical protein